MTTLNDFNKVDGVTRVMAAHVNDMLGGILRSEYGNVETLSGTRVLLDVDTPTQRFDCDGADRIVTVPDPNTVENHLYFLVNASSADEIITVKSFDETTTIYTILAGRAVLAVPDGNGGYLVIRDDASTDTGGIGKNVLSNGDFAIAQRGTSFTSATTPANNNDTYLLDRWILLSDGNDIVDVSQVTSETTHIRMDVETANKKFGLLQILENKKARQLTSKAVSLSFKAKVVGTTIGSLRAAILSWNSTADVVTSDVRTAWGAAGTNPTLATNWTYENTPASLSALTTSWQTFKIENVSIDTASTTNVAVFIWTDDTTMNIGDFLDIKEAKLETGAAATEFDYTPYDENLRECQRRCEKISNIDTYSIFALGFAKSTTKAQFLIEFKTQKSGQQTLTFSAGSTFLLSDGTTNTAGTAIAAIASEYSTSGMIVEITVASGLTQFRSMQLVANNQSSGNAWLMAECEL